MKTKEQLLVEIKSHISAAKSIADRVESESRGFTTEEQKKVEAHLGEVRLLEKEIKNLDPEGAEARRKAMDEEIMRQIEQLDGGMNNKTYPGGKAPGPWSKAFFDRLGAKQLVTPSGSVGVPSLSGTIPAAAERLQTILQALTPTSTDNSSIEYLREVTRTHAAAPVAAGATKPTSTYELEEIDAPVEQIAHLTEPVKRVWLSDAPNLQRYLDTVLRQGVQLALEDAIINGTGVTPDLQGMLTVSGRSVLVPDGTDLLSLARQGVTILELLSLPVDGMYYVVNPLVWEQMELLERNVTGAEGGYKMNVEGGGRAPIDRQLRRLWSCPVIPSIAMPETSILLFHRSAVELYEREGVRVDWSENTISIVEDVPISDFVRNLIRFRAEGRYCLAIYKPDAIVEIVLEVGS